jgi:predicted histidine transporter YuiF (NhaC family)
VGGIHGRALTAWAAGGIFGPVLVNYIRQYQVSHGVPPSQSYTETMYIMAALLIVGIICNFFVHPVSPRHHMTAEQLGATATQPAMGH